ncbi:MAG: hypothetical protein HC828_09070 [Blastochloris sp.]|nr:hypothetical protein [Blastochloris sp.]
MRISIRSDEPDHFAGCRPPRSVVAATPHPDEPGGRQWAANLTTAGARVHIAEIADYEVRRELLRARKRRGLEWLNQLKADCGYVVITTATMLRTNWL